jgi:hypothetical protein
MKNDKDNNQTNNDINPWKGLAPYQKDDGYLFCGRADEVRTLTSLIEKNTIVTLYGRSGVGKTSLITAGVFARLIQLGNYSPTVVRLSVDPEPNESMEECIERSIIKASSDKDGRGGMKLPEFIKNNSFNNTIPVVVLDQFEEVLRNGQVKQPLEILRALRSILDNYPEKIRFVISIREDDLYRLEDLLDTNHIDRLKQNRYRLRDISKEGALQVVNAVAYHANIKIEDGLFDKLYNKLQQDDQPTDESDTSATGGNSPDSEVSTLLLSLYCNRMYRSMMQRNDKEKMITTADINILGAKPLLQYYREAIRGLSNKQITFIDSMAEGGYRTPKPLSELNKQLGNHTEYLCKVGDSRQLFLISSSTTNNNSTNDPPYELLHDRLAKNIYEDRLQRDIENRKKRGQRVILALGIIAFCLLAFKLLLWSTDKYPTFKPTKTHNGTLYPKIKPYTVPSGHLVLGGGINLYIDAIKRNDVIKLTLDSAMIIGTRANYNFPNLDTVEILSGYQYPEDLYLSNAKVLKIHRPNVITIIEHHIITITHNKNIHSSGLDYKEEREETTYERPIIHAPSLRKDKCIFVDTNYLVWSCGTIFTKRVGGWTPIITSWDDGSIYACVSDFPKDENDSVPIIYVNDSSLIYDYDIANPPTIDHNKKYRIVCNDPAIKKVGREHIGGINKNNILFVDLKTVDTINTRMFLNCHNLKEVNLSQAKEIGYQAFSDCEDLTRLKVDNVVIVQPECFYNDSLLQLVSMPKVEVVGDAAFHSCSHLDSVFMPRLKITLDCAFQYTALRVVNQPEMLHIGKYAYANCNKLESVNMETVSEIDSEKCFAWCTKLKVANLPNLKKVTAGMFTGCRMLHDVSIPNVTSIGDTAFKNNRQLRHIIIPKVETIGPNAFKDCFLLEDISWGVSDPRYDSTSFDGCKGLSKFYYANGVIAPCDTNGEHRIPINKNKNTVKNTSNIIHKKGYDIVGNTIVITADTIGKLVIPRYVTNIVGLDPNKVIKKVRMERGKRGTGYSKGMFYSIKDQLLVYTSSERVSASYIDDYGLVRTPDVPLPKTAKEVIVFSPMFDSILPEGCTLLVPHGQKWRFEEKWDKVEELSALETAFYLPIIVFGSTPFYLADILVWIISLAIMFMLWSIFAPPNLKKLGIYLPLIPIVVYMLVTLLAMNGFPILRRLAYPRPFAWLRLSIIIISLWAIFLLCYRYYPFIKEFISSKHKLSRQK